MSDLTSPKTPLLSSELDYKESFRSESAPASVATAPVAIDIKSPRLLSPSSHPASDTYNNDERKEFASPRLNSPSAASSSNSSSSPASPHPTMTVKDQKRYLGIPYQYQIFLRAVLILSSLAVGGWALLYYVPDQFYLAWIPEFAFAGIAYLSYFPRPKLRLKSYLRLCSLLLVVSLHQTMCALPVVWVIRLLSDDGIGWRYAMLCPYFFGLMVFGRLSPVIRRHDPRSLLVHILYDPPALLTCFVYSVIFKSPLNRLYTPITERLVLGSLPFKPDVEVLKKAGVSAVVNMCAEYSGPVSEYNRFGIEQCRLPTTDMSAPTVEQLRTGVAFMTKHLEQDDGSRVMVHCKNGMSRSACMVVSYLCASQGLTPIEAVKLIKHERGEVSTDLLDYPSVQEFCGSLPHVQRQQKKVERETDKEKEKEEELGQGAVASTINQRIVA